MTRSRNGANPKLPVETMRAILADPDFFSKAFGFRFRERKFAPLLAKPILAACVLAALANPVGAQNLLERSVAPPAYKEQEQPPSFAPPPAQHSTAQPRPQGPTSGLAPGASPLAPGQASKPDALQPGAAPAGPAEPPPPYEPQLLRLSELLGALTYLQDLCGGQKGDIWRDKMTALMDAETQDETRRERLAGAYNRGFKGYELNYRQCTPNAQAIITRFLNESGKIARDVTRRYGTS